MSRTYRRKKRVPREVKFDQYWVFTDPLTPRSRADYKKELAYYRSDAYYPKLDTGAAPKWYNKMLDRSRKSRDRQELKRINLNPEYEAIFDSWKRDAGWTWW